MKYLPKLLALALILFTGCSSLRKAEPSRRVAFSIADHYVCGANSVEIKADTLSRSDLAYLREKFTVSTNYYVSGGATVEFVEIKW